MPPVSLAMGTGPSSQACTCVSMETPLCLFPGLSLIRTNFNCLHFSGGGTASLQLSPFAPNPPHAPSQGEEAARPALDGAGPSPSLPLVQPEPLLFQKGCVLLLWESRVPLLGCCSLTPVSHSTWHANTLEGPVGCLVWSLTLSSPLHH